MEKGKDRRVHPFYKIQTGWVIAGCNMTLQNDSLHNNITKNSITCFTTQLPFVNIIENFWKFLEWQSCTKNIGYVKIILLKLISG